MSYDKYKFYRKYHDEKEPQRVSESDVLKAVSRFHKSTLKESSSLVEEMKINPKKTYSLCAAVYWCEIYDPFGYEKRNKSLK